MIATAMACRILTGTRPGGPVFYTEEELKGEDFRVALAQARAAGMLPEPVRVIEGRPYGGSTAMPESVTAFREDDQSQNGKTKPSPFV